jgi:type IV secretion system protein VirB8
MDSLTNSVLINERSGQYYVDAQNWHFHRYVYPILERSFIFCISILTAVVASIAIIAFLSLFPISQAIDVGIPIREGSESQPVMNELPQGENNVEIVIAKFLATKYVEYCESYEYAKLADQLSRVQNLSSKVVFKKFYNYIDTQNADSPVLLYQRYLTRHVEIISTTFLPEYENIIVKFKAIVQDHRNGNKDETLWIANIRYNMSDINKVLRDKTKFEFMVTDYATKQIN